MNNPLLKKLKPSKNISQYTNIQNVVIKELILLAITIISALITINIGFANLHVTITSILIGFGLLVLMHFKHKWAKYLSWLFAITEGIFLGYFSLLLETSYPGIAIQAILLTLITAGIVAFIYYRNIITIDQSLKNVIMILLIGLLTCYGIEIIIGLIFNYSFTVLNAGIGGIIIDIGIFILTCFCLLLDYNDIANLSNDSDPNIEWYYATSLLVTLVWMFIRITQLLEDSK